MNSDLKIHERKFLTKQELKIWRVRHDAEAKKYREQLLKELPNALPGLVIVDAETANS